MDVLRFITAGNVDDGKSTLIGRLLYDTGSIKSDVLHSVSGADKDAINLAHITDGLRSEREQGITIDVAYKYFTTPHRKYIITDAPGHYRYTHNLVTGASNADLIIILIDAGNGITDQTRRHTLVASFLGIGHIVVAINKMDSIAYDTGKFQKIKEDFEYMTSRLHLPAATYIPISALIGDNVSARSRHMDWYRGPTLLQYLEACQPAKPTGGTRFSIQHIATHDGKTLCIGKMHGGTLHLNNAIIVSPGARPGLISKITHGYNVRENATAGDNIIIELLNDVPAERGDIISLPTDKPCTGHSFTATLCWLDAIQPLHPGKEYYLRIGAQETMCRIQEIQYITDIQTFESQTGAHTVTVNQFAVVTIETKNAIAFDPFHISPETGRGVIIDVATNYTSGAFTIEGASE